MIVFQSPSLNLDRKDRITLFVNSPEYSKLMAFLKRRVNFKFCPASTKQQQVREVHTKKNAPAAAGGGSRTAEGF